MERETGIEPATNSLEGCDSTIELLPQREPLYQEGLRNRAPAPSGHRLSNQPQQSRGLDLVFIRVFIMLWNQFQGARQARPDADRAEVAPVTGHHPVDSAAFCYGSHAPVYQPQVQLLESGIEFQDASDIARGRRARIRSAREDRKSRQPACASRPDSLADRNPLLPAPARGNDHAPCGSQDRLARTSSSSSRTVVEMSRATMPLSFRDNRTHLGKSWGGPTACAGPVAPLFLECPGLSEEKGRPERPPQATGPPHNLCRIPSCGKLKWHWAHSRRTRGAGRWSQGRRSATPRIPNRRPANIPSPLAAPPVTRCRNIRIFSVFIRLHHPEPPRTTGAPSAPMLP